MSDNRIIGIGIVNDPIGANGMSPEEEACDIIRLLRSLGLACELDFHATGMQDAIYKNPDMLLIDYGGMSDLGAWDAAQYQVRYACRWAEAHPGRPMVIWTVYTKYLYEGELEDQFGHLENVFMRYQSEHYDDIPFIERIAIWLDVKLDHRITNAKSGLKKPGRYK